MITKIAKEIALMICPVDHKSPNEMHHTCLVNNRRAIRAIEEGLRQGRRLGIEEAAKRAEGMIVISHTELEFRAETAKKIRAL